MKFCVLIPAYNEENTITQLITQIKSYHLDVFVVDDGSNDKTAHFARQAQAFVLSHCQNLGKGQALRTGFDYLKGKDYDGVVILDADGQHSPDEINFFLQRAEHSDAGIIIGNRMYRPQGMPFIRRTTNIVTSYFISRIVGYKIPDSQCGFRFVRIDVLKKINLSTIKYDTDSEILIEAAKNNFQIESIPIKTIYSNHKSQIHPVIDTIRFMKLMRRSIFRK